MNLENFDPMQWLMVMVVLIIAITIHEFAHAIAADRLGDPTPRSQGRISLNPIDHLEPTGTIMMAVSTAVGFGIGWGRPVLTQPANFKHPRRDMLLVALAGPVSNILQAFLFAGVLRLLVGRVTFAPNGLELLNLAVQVNLALAFFNLIPVPPLDGSKIFSSLLPLPQAQVYERTMSQIGFLLFMALAFTGLAGRLIGPPVALVYNWLLG